MAKNAFSDWSSTASDNTDVGGISLEEGVMLPSAVNNAFREMMAQLKGAGFVGSTYFVKASASGPAKFYFAEDTDNGTNKVTLQAPSALAADVTVTLPSATGTLLGSGDVAAAADFRANTADKVLDTDGVWAAAAEVTLTDAATITFDQSSGINFKVTLGGNRTIGQPSSTINGKTGRIIVKQDATGSRTLSWHADFEFASGTAPTLSTTAGAEDVFYYDQLAANRTLITGPVRAVA